MPDYKSDNYEEASIVESKPLHSTFQDSTPEPSPEPQTSKEEEIQPSEFPFSLEEDFFEDFWKHLELFLPKETSSSLSLLPIPTKKNSSRKPLKC